MTGSPFSSTIFRDCGSLHTVGYADILHHFCIACGPLRCSTCDTSGGRSHARMTQVTSASYRNLRKRIPLATCSSTLFTTIMTTKFIPERSCKIYFYFLHFITVGYVFTKLPTHLRIADNTFLYSIIIIIVVNNNNNKKMKTK